MILAMNLLILDTSKKEGFVALSKKGELLICKTLLSKEFLPHVVQLIQEAIEPLAAIAVGIGPGSYTGTRAGATFAKTLAFAKHIPVIGFYSPLAFLPEGAGPFASTIPGKRNDTSLLTGKKTSYTIIEHTRPRMVPNEELQLLLPSFPLQIESEHADLNLPPLLPYLQDRLDTKDYNLNGEVDIAYLYDIPAPATGTQPSKKKCSSLSDRRENIKN